MIAFLAFVKMGCLVAESKPVMMSGSENSGRTLETGSSSLMRPRWTHCKAEMEVRSFVQEAIQNTAPESLSFAFGSNDSFPTAFSYLYDGSVSTGQRREEWAQSGRSGKCTSSTCDENGVCNDALIDSLLDAFFKRLHLNGLRGSLCCEDIGKVGRFIITPP